MENTGGPVIHNPIAIMRKQEEDKTHLRQGDITLQTVEHQKKLQIRVLAIEERLAFLEEQVAKQQTAKPLTVAK